MVVADFTQHKAGVYYSVADLCDRLRNRIEGVLGPEPVPHA